MLDKSPDEVKKHLDAYVGTRVDITYGELRRVLDMWSSNRRGWARAAVAAGRGATAEDDPMDVGYVGGGKGKKGGKSKKGPWNDTSKGKGKRPRPRRRARADPEVRGRVLFLQAVGPQARSVLDGT